MLLFLRMGKDEKKKDDSFLHDTQMDGKGNAKMTKKDLDEAIASVHMIMDVEVAKELKGKKTEDVDAIKMSIYCHDCRAIVPAGIGKGRKGKMRTVCGTCNSRKISSGRQEALESYYHIKENQARKKEQDENKMKKRGKKVS